MARRWKCARSCRPIARRCWLRSTGPAQRRDTAAFFGPKNGFSEKELEFFLNVDFIKHVALAAVLNEAGAGIHRGRRTLRRLEARRSRNCLRHRRSTPEAGYRHPADEASGRDRRARIAEVGCRGAARERAHAPGLRALRPCHDGAPGPRRRSHHTRPRGTTAAA